MLIYVIQLQFWIVMYLMFVIHCTCMYFLFHCEHNHFGVFIHLLHFSWLSWYKNSTTWYNMQQRTDNWTTLYPMCWLADSRTYFTALYPLAAAILNTWLWGVDWRPCTCPRWIERRIRSFKKCYLNMKCFVNSN